MTGKNPLPFAGLCAKAAPEVNSRDIDMPHESQTALVREIAALLREYRANRKAFAKFGARCGMALNEAPVGCIIMSEAGRKDEQFQCRDAELRKGQPSEKDAFFAALDKFSGLGAFLAWNGVTPPGKFDVVRDMGEDFAHPTFAAEIVYKRRGEDHDNRLNMLFVGFADEAAAQDYAGRKAALVK